MQRTGHAISVIIPALNNLDQIGSTIQALQGLSDIEEIIVVDGGSVDGTAERSAELGARIVQCEAGRGRQMQLGATLAHGKILWFVHPDTLAPKTATEEICRVMEDAHVIGGCFAVRVMGKTESTRLLNWNYAHLARMGLHYGAAGYFVWREAYEMVGGFRPLPVFEDLDLYRRLGTCGRLVTLNSHMTILPQRFKGQSLSRTFARWSGLLLLYCMRMPASTMERFSRKLRPAGSDGFPRLAQTQDGQMIPVSRKYLI